MAPFLITGLGKSATRWAAEFFTALGHPCSHETQYGLDRHGPLDTADASWLAVPYLDDVHPSTRIVRMIRDPYRVVRSAMRVEYLADADDPYTRFTCAHEPWVCDTDDHLTRVIRWVASWDRPVDDRAYVPLDPARQTVGEIRDVAEWTTGEWYPAEHIARVLLGVGVVHRSAGAVEVTRDQIDAHPEGSLIRARAERWGYL